MTEDIPPTRAMAPRTDAHLAAGRIVALRGMLRVAEVLAREGREIDLSGLEERVGRLCAGVLDLPPESGRGLRAELALLLGDVDTLAALLRSRPPAG